MVWPDARLTVAECCCNVRRIPEDWMLRSMWTKREAFLYPFCAIATLIMPHWARQNVFVKSVDMLSPLICPTAFTKLLCDAGVEMLRQSLSPTRNNVLSTLYVTRVIKYPRLSHSGREAGNGHHTKRLCRTCRKMKNIAFMLKGKILHHHCL